MDEEEADKKEKMEKGEVKEEEEYEEEEEIITLPLARSPPLTHHLSKSLHQSQLSY